MTILRTWNWKNCFFVVDSVRGAVEIRMSSKQRGGCCALSGFSAHRE
jgi:hypothetical protein